jgi:hypothetical protein
MPRVAVNRLAKQLLADVKVQGKEGGIALRITVNRDLESGKSKSAWSTVPQSVKLYPLYFR